MSRIGSRISLVLVCALAVVGSARLQSWGLDGHRAITRRALDALPSDLGRVLRADADFIAEHSVDPDLWRVVDLGDARGPEAPNHFLDLDGLDEPPPFTGVPRTWDAFVARYGEARAERAGRLPWRVEQMYALLVDRLRAVRTNARGSYAAGDARYVAAVLAHYVEDAFVPFHAVANYDGQLTGQRGIHARFETALLARYGDQLRLAPVRVTPITDIRAFIFDALTEGVGQATTVLAADRRARQAAGDDDDKYFAAWFADVRPVLERRLAGAASAVASVFVAAWEDAGRPAP